jgi:DNA-binding beta-propeller fold protein YncE
MRGPVGVAIGPEGSVYVADAGNYRVQVFSPEGELLQLWEGPSGFTPWGIAVDPQGSVYVTDLMAHTVYKFSPDGELRLSWGGLGTADGQFTGPTGVAVSPQGEIYVVDSLGYRVQVFTPDGEFLLKWGSFCSLYTHPGRGCRDPDGAGPLEMGDGQFESPWGIAFDSQGRVYVADSANKRIQVFTPDGKFLFKWGKFGRGPAEFDNPVGIAIDGRDHIYVADLNNNRIQVFAFPQEPPTILAIELPQKIALNSHPIPGTVHFQDPDGDLRAARFRVIDGKYDPFTIELDLVPGQTEGSFNFTVSCTISQRVTLKLVLVDRAGNRSEPEGFSFTCGTPPQGNYDKEQQTVRPTEHTLGINIFILDDGVTTLAEGAVYPSAEAAVGRPREEVGRAIEGQVVPAVTGIWDQCSVGYKLQNLVVVRPQSLKLGEHSLDELLFVRAGELAEIALSDPSRRRPLALLEEALEPLGEALELQGSNLDPRALNVFITGARLVLRPGDELHFGGVTTLGGRVSLVRWDSIWVIDKTTGEIFPPKRPITAIAHEFGHNFGLRHLSLEDDPLNLMLSVPGQPTAVPPQPTVNLLDWQCEQVKPIVEELALRDDSR